MRIFFRQNQTRPDGFSISGGEAGGRRGPDSTGPGEPAAAWMRRSRETWGQPDLSLAGRSPLQSWSRGWRAPGWGWQRGAGARRAQMGSVWAWRAPAPSWEGAEPRVYIERSHLCLYSLHQNRINLAAKNRQGNYQNRQGNDPWRPAAKQNPPRIERQYNAITLAAGRQV